MNPYDIINRLRKYTPIGMGFLEDGKAYIEEFASQIGQYVPDIVAYDRAMLALTDSSNKLSAGLQTLATMQEKYNDGQLKAVKSATFLLEREKELAKTFGITAIASAKLSYEYSITADKLKISTDLMSKYRVSINKILPGMSENILRSGEYGESLVRTNDYLQRHIGLTGEQTNALTLAAAATGTDLETSVNNTAKFAAEYEKATGEVGVFKDVMEGVANTSIELRSEYSKFPGSLEVATLKARRLGMSMSDIDKSATSLLDIESSVGKELEYQLISGKRLVDNQGNSLTNKLREAKLSGNATDAANAMTEILTTQSDIIEHGNYLQKQALADAMGLTAEQLVGANAQMKLQDMIYAKMKEAKKLEVGGRVIKSAVELTTEDIAAGMKEFGKTMSDTEKAAATENLKKTESLITPAEQTADYLKMIIDKGIKVQIDKTIASGAGTYDKLLADSTTGIAESLKEFTASTKFLFEQDARDIGKNQLMAQMATDFLETTKLYTETKVGSVKILGWEPLADAFTKATEVVSNIYGKVLEPSVTQTSPNAGNEVSTTTEKDAFMMHDGIIKFDDRDKFTMIASPYGAMHERVADKITGGGNAGAGLDSNTIAKAIQSAIQAGLSNVSWTVNLDPMSVDKAIKFNSGRLNS